MSGAYADDLECGVCDDTCDLADEGGTKLLKCKGCGLNVCEECTDLHGGVDYCPDCSEPLDESED